jgi:cyanophycin synthetase
MEIRKVLALRGPNIWANFPVLEAWVDIKEFEDAPSDMLPGFNERLMSWLPSMVEHRCSEGVRGGFFERLRRGTWMAHILEHVTIELQSLAGNVVGYGRARGTTERGVYKVAVEYKEEEVGRAALETAYRLCLAAAHDTPFDVTAEVAKLRDLAHEVCLGPSTMGIVRAAQARGIPYRRLNKDSMVQFGYGAKQRRIVAAETDRTGAIAEQIAQDKELTRSLLRNCGVPVPAGRPVESAEDAWETAEDLGLPVVVKPQFGNQGRGVATNLSTREQVVAAYNAAREESSYIVVERFAPGSDYRLLVVGEKVVAAAKREPAQVIGDGRSSIRQLVEEVNKDPRRSSDHATALTTIKLNDIALQVLAEQGYTAESFPPAGQKVIIRRNCNLSTGGTAADVTEEVHPEVAARAVEAAKVVGLDVAGVDVVALDIGRPLEEQAGVIVEVNAAPGLRMHLQPSSGKPQPVAEAIVATLYPEGQNGRIPVVAVTGTNGKTTTTRLIAHLFRTIHKTVGMTCTDGIYVGERRIEAGDCAGPLSAQMVLMNPNVEVAVLETARGGILRAGLGFDLCDVSVVTNIAEGDHLGLSDIETPEKLAKVKRCIVEATAKTGNAVLKADDPLTAAMAEKCKGSVIFFCLDPEHPVIKEHRLSGGRAIFVRHNTVILAEADVEIPLVSLANVPLTHGGRIGFQVENALAAAAAAWGLGVPRDMIRAGLESFAADMQRVPGRFNLFEINGATIVVDYGHNVSSLSALINTFDSDSFPSDRRGAVYSAAGDRRDSDMIRQGQLLGNAFDRVILYEDHYLRGRKPGEIMGLFRQGLEQGSRVRQVEEAAGALKAVETALKAAQPGELWLVQADTIDETVDYIRRYLAAVKDGRPLDLSETDVAPALPPTNGAIPAALALPTMD